MGAGLCNVDAQPSRQGWVWQRGPETGQNHNSGQEHIQTRVLLPSSLIRAGKSRQEQSRHGGFAVVSRC